MVTGDETPQSIHDDGQGRDRHDGCSDEEILDGSCHRPIKKSSRSRAGPHFFESMNSPIRIVVHANQAVRSSDNCGQPRHGRW